MLPDLDENRLRQAFQETERDTRIHHAIVGCILILILVPAGSILDYFVYPHLFWKIFWVRIACDLIVLPTFILLWTGLGKQYVQALGALWALAPMFTVCWMIYISEGIVSPYYGGLNLMIIGCCQLMPYTVIEASLYCIVVIVSYIAACWFHTPTGLDISRLLNNLYFLVLTSVICVAARHFYNMRRLSDFKLRYELNIRNKQLTELDQLKSQFFANVSHELRTPLALILAPVEDLLHRQPPLPETVGYSLALVKKNGQRLLGVINDLLEIVRLEKGRLKLERKPMHLGKFVREMVDSVRGLAVQSNLTIDVAEMSNDPIIVLGDKSRLEKVLLNLFTNAVKFTPSGGNITVRVWKDGDSAKVEVADSGIGISEEELPYIFDRFRQVGDRTGRHHQGLGLGLALAKELVEEHGGQLAARSKVEEGTAFEIALPMVDTGETNAALADDEKPDSTDDLVEMFWESNQMSTIAGLGSSDDLAVVGEGDSRILVVDDEPDMRRFLVSILAENYTVMQAIDGESALEVAKKKKPNVVVLDLMLPGMNGLDVCKAFRRDNSMRDVKIIMLTARIDEGVKIEALECGADDFLTKPFSTTEVKTRVGNLLRTATLQEGLRIRNQKLEETLTQLQAAEAQLIQSEKMNALGSLTAGMLHEINNPLNYAMLALELAKLSASREDIDISDTLDDIDEGMTRIRDIVTDLRAFAYPKTIDMREEYDILEAIQTALRLTSHELSRLQVETDGFGNHRVMGARTHIIQVLINMLTNAARAIEPIGRDRPGKIRLSSESNGDRLYIHVWDNGVGINESVIPRIMDPFFTTSEVGHGMGLGLSICHTIVQNHGGTITIQSDEGNWTQFTFDLPLQKVEN